MVTVALPEIGRDLDLELGGLQWVMNAYLLALSALMITGGSLERAGHVPVATARRMTVSARPAGILAAVCAAIGVPLMLVFDGGAGLAVGVVLLLTAVAAAAVFVVPQVVDEKGPAVT